jgi:hypothetical protein
MRNNCFIDNDDRIAPVILSKTSFNVQSSFVQHKTNVLSATQCEFLSIAMAGSSLDEGYHGSFTCEMSDMPACSVPALRKADIDIPCERSLQGIVEIERNVGIGNLTRTFILCSNTNFNVDEFGPLDLQQSNIRILCGPEGRQLNNCVLEQGSIQISVMSDEASIENVSISGLTFTQASLVNVAVQTPSEVLLNDCVFKVRPNV